MESRTSSPGNKPSLPTVVKSFYLLDGRIKIWNNNEGIRVYLALLLQLCDSCPSGMGLKRERKQVSGNILKSGKEERRQVSRSQVKRMVSSEQSLHTGMCNSKTARASELYILFFKHL